MRGSQRVDRDCDGQGGEVGGMEWMRRGEEGFLDCGAQATYFGHGRVLAAIYLRDSHQPHLESNGQADAGCRVEDVKHRLEGGDGGAA